MLSYIIPRLLHRSLLLDGVVALPFLLARRGLLSIHAVTVITFGVFGTLLRLFGVFLGVLAGVPSGVLVVPTLPGSYSDNLRFALRYITPAEEADL